MSEWWEEHAKEVAGNGRYPIAREYIDGFIASKARKSEGYAIAYAILQLGNQINGGLHAISGVDDYTGIMRIGAWLEELVKVFRLSDPQRSCIAGENER